MQVNSCKRYNKSGAIKIKGVYRHFKGALYYVLGEGVVGSSGERLVVYKALSYKTDIDLFVRPLNMFFGKNSSGKNRFERVYSFVKGDILTDNSIFDSNSGGSKLIGVAMHTETEELFIVYKKVTGSGEYFNVVSIGDC